VGLSEQSAATTLQADGLAATTATTSKCDSADSGDVLSQGPAARTVVLKGTSVTLGVCSPPPPPVTVIVPNVVGLSEQSAAATLQADGLAATTTTTSSCATASSGDVLSQSPAANAAVGRGTSVTLGVCSSPPPVTVPNVVGTTQQDATATLENDGLTVTAGTTSECGKFGDGTVVTQSPPAGTSVPANTGATIAVCDVTPIP